MKKFVLDENHDVREAENEEDWFRFMESNAFRIVGNDIIGGLRVSTVFLHFDHGYEGAPLLFETMIFGIDGVGPLGDYQERYATWDEAVSGHATAVEIAKRHESGGK